MQVAVWVTLIAFTAIVPGCITGILAHARRWTPYRCSQTARAGGWAVLAAGFSICWLAGMKQPLLLQLFWMAVADIAPRLIARRIAFPNLKA